MRHPMQILSGFVLLILGLSFSPALAEENWLVMTEELPPYNFKHNGQIDGISTDILLLMMKESNMLVRREDIQLLPWPRAYVTAQNTPGSILFSAARTPVREQLFKWVGPVTDLTISLIAQKKKQIQIRTLEDLHAYKIGTIRNGAPEQLVLTMGVKEEELDRIATPESNIRKLQAGRIDLFAFSMPSTCYIMRELGIDPNDYESVYTLKQADLYFAFHKDTDDEVINTLNTTLRRLQQPDSQGKSTVSRIIEGYLGADPL